MEARVANQREGEGKRTDTDWTSRVHTLHQKPETVNQKVNIKNIHFYL